MARFVSHIHFIIFPSIKKFDKWFFIARTLTAKETSLVDFNRTHRFVDFIADGLTIDKKGNLYVAAFGASRILVVDPRKGKISHEIDMPTRQVTSMAFGGRKLKTLYVTTADKDRTLQGSAGGLFKITGLGVQGLPMTKFKRNHK